MLTRTPGPDARAVSVRLVLVFSFTVTSVAFPVRTETAPPVQPTSEGLRYTSTWVGSTWPGGPQWVQTAISGLAPVGGGG